MQAAADAVAAYEAAAAATVAQAGVVATLEAEAKAASEKAGETWKAYTKEVNKVVDLINEKTATSSTATGLGVYGKPGLLIMTLTKAFIWQKACDNVIGAASLAAAIAANSSMPIYFGVGFDAQLSRKKSTLDKTVTRKDHFCRKGLQTTPAILELTSNPRSNVTVFSIQHDIHKRCDGKGNTDQVTLDAKYAYQTRFDDHGNRQLVYAEIPDSYP